MWEDSHWAGWVVCYFTCMFARPVLLQQLLSNKASDFLVDYEFILDLFAFLSPDWVMKIEL